MIGCTISSISFTLSLFTLSLFPRWGSTSLVKLGNDWLYNFFHFFLLSFHLFCICLCIFFQPGNLFINNLFNLLLVLITKFTTQFLFVAQLILKTVSITLQFITSLNFTLQLGVFISKLLGIIDHSLNIFGGQSILVIGDGNFLLVIGALVFGRYLQNSVGINLKGDFNLGHATGCWGNVVEVEFAKKMVVLGHGTFTLEYLDGDSVLIISSSREYLRFLSRDHSVPCNQFSHNTAYGLNTHGQRVNIQQDKVASVLFSGQHTSLYGSSVSHGFVRVDAS